MPITFSVQSNIDKNQLQDLFLSVDWDSGNYPEKLAKAIAGSHTVFTAWDGELLVGLVNVLSDGHMAAYVHYLLVRPEYQGKGIGKHLIKLVSDQFENVMHKLLVAYDAEIGFYEQCGFERPDGTSPMFMTSLKI